MGFVPSSFMRFTHHRSSLSMKLSPVTGGSVVAIVTPMTSNNEIDYAKFIELLQWHVQEGTDGAVILGTTGEGSMISLSERSEIIKTAVRVVNKAFPIIVGAGTIEPSKVIELSQNALDNGADATLLITPYYVKPPQRALVQHYKYIADNVPIPMILYNCPGRTGVDMKPETIAQLASHPYIIGVKDATGDLDRVKKIRTLCGEKFLIFRYIYDYDSASDSIHVFHALLSIMIIISELDNDNAVGDTTPLHDMMFLLYHHHLLL